MIMSKKPELKSQQINIMSFSFLFSEVERLSLFLLSLIGYKAKMRCIYIYIEIIFNIISRCELLMNNFWKESYINKAWIFEANFYTNGLKLLVNAVWSYDGNQKTACFIYRNNWQVFIEHLLSVLFSLERHWWTWQKLLTLQCLCSSGKDRP